MVQARIDLPMDAIREICRRYHVRELSLFGSVLRDDFRSDSDVDFLVEFGAESQVGYLALFHMQDELSAILRRPVDLVSKRGLKPVMRDDVLSQARVIYETLWH